MKIAVLAPIAHKTPPDDYGPWELMASTLAEGLVEKGHEVTLFATADSKTRGRLESVAPVGTESLKMENKYVNIKMWEYEHIANCFEKAGEFDIIHSHFNFGPLAFSRLVKTPVVTTVHSGKVEFAWGPMLSMYKKYNSTNHYVAISESAKHPDLKYAGTVYNGINLNDFEYAEKPGEYLLFLGRIDSDKGAAEAIHLAKKTNHKLVIAGIINDREYFDKHIEAEIDGTQIDFVGSVAGKAKSDVLKNAKALLHLANFDEPFGLTVVEAQACGTPVIAFRRGAMPEVISDKKTGFLADNFKQACDLVSGIGEISRKNCRTFVEEKFSREKMISGYEEVYRKVISAYEN